MGKYMALTCLLKNKTCVIDVGVLIDGGMQQVVFCSCCAASMLAAEEHCYLVWLVAKVAHSCHVSFLLVVSMDVAELLFGSYTCVTCQRKYCKPQQMYMW